MRLALIALVFSCLSPSEVLAAPPIDLLLVNGHIYTGDAKKPWAQSIAISDGKVLSTGSDQDLLSLRSQAHSVRDLKGGTVIPGLVDDHVHPLVAATDMLGYRCTFSVYSAMQEILTQVAKCAADAAPDEWIIGQYWSSILLPDLSTAEALAALDKAAGGRPVMLGDDTTHNRWVSSAAMRLAGITDKTPDPDGGHIVRDRDGKALGIFVERPAANLIDAVTPLAQLSKVFPLEDLLALSIAKLNSFGVTAFQDARIIDPAVGLAYRSLDQAEKLNAQVALMTMFDGHNLGDPLAVMGVARQATSKRVETNYAKLYLDGVMTTRTAAFVQPYLPGPDGDACFTGALKIPSADLTALVVRLDAMKVVIKLHAAGDAAVRQALDAVQVARTLNGDSGPIHQIAHAGYVQDDDLKRFAALRVAVDAAPTVWFPGPIATATSKQIGQERAFRYWPFKTMLEMGILVAGGTDWKTLPGEQSYIWAGIEGMVTRQDPSRQTPGAMWPEQALTVEQAINAYTIGSATAMGLQDRMGTLEAGKAANLAILDRDIFSAPANSLYATQILETIFEGRTVFKAGSPDPVEEAAKRFAASQAKNRARSR